VLPGAATGRAAWPASDKKKPANPEGERAKSTGRLHVWETKEFGKAPETLFQPSAPE
jgi:hypothetical protein